MIFASVDLDSVLRARRRDAFGFEIDALARAAGVDARLVAGWLFIESPRVAPLPLTAAHRAALELHAPSAAPAHSRNRSLRLST